MYAGGINAKLSKKNNETQLKGDEFQISAPGEEICSLFFN